VDFYLATLSRIHASCGPLVQEALAGNSQAPVEELAKIARAMFKGRSEYLCESAMSITDRLRKVADMRTQQVLSLILLYCTGHSVCPCQVHIGVNVPSCVGQTVGQTKPE
jgi:hypothetical protein